MVSRSFPDKLLDKKRQQGDPLADELIKFVVQKRDPQEVLDILQGMVRMPDETDIDAALQEYFPNAEVRQRIQHFLEASASSPEWLDVNKLAIGTRLFREQVFLAFIVLACASLPTAYSAIPDVKILGYTGGLSKDIPRRIPETAQMLVDVLGSQGLQSDGERLTGIGLRSLQKVRLMHALVRVIVSDDDVRKCLNDNVQRITKNRSGNDASMFFLQGFLDAATHIHDNPKSLADDKWNSNKDGVPINQETLAGTLITFSYIILQGWRTIGIRISRQEEIGYLHCWCVAGHVLGIDADFTTRLGNLADCEDLFDQILRRRCHPELPNATGRQLESVLLNYIKENQRRVIPWARLLQLHRCGKLTTHWLVRRPIRKALGIKLSLMDRLVQPINWLILKIFGILKNVPLFKHAAQGFFRWVSRHVWSWRVLDTDKVVKQRSGGKPRGVVVPKAWQTLPKKHQDNDKSDLPGDSIRVDAES